MKREIPPHLLWPGMIIGLLLLGVVSTFWLVASAHSDGGVVAVADYQTSDEVPARVAEAQRSAALGWTIAPTRAGDTLRLAVSDRAGAPVTGLHGTVVVSRPHVALALDTVALAETAPGTYAVPLTAPAPGLWDFTFDAVRSADRFLGTLRDTLR